MIRLIPLVLMTLLATGLTAAAEESGYTMARDRMIKEI